MLDEWHALSTALTERLLWTMSVFRCFLSDVHCTSENCKENVKIIVNEEVVQVFENLNLKFVYFQSEIILRWGGGKWSGNKHLPKSLSPGHFSRNDGCQDGAVKLIYTVLKKLNTSEKTFLATGKWRSLRHFNQVNLGITAMHFPTRNYMKKQIKQNGSPNAMITLGEGAGMIACQLGYYIHTFPSF